MTEEKGIPLLFESAKPGRDREGIPENGNVVTLMTVFICGVCGLGFLSVNHLPKNPVQSNAVPWHHAAGSWAFPDRPSFKPQLSRFQMCSQQCDPQTWATGAPALGTAF